jgi:DNA mismatch repair protein MutS
VTRVVTPGTLVEDNLLEAGRNNYLVAFLSDGEAAGLAYVDVSTAEFVCLQGFLEDVRGEILRLRPAELLLAPGLQPPTGLAATLTPLTASSARPEAAVDGLLQHFGVPAIEALGLSGHTLAAAAAGVAVAYLRENQPLALGHITSIRLDQPGGYLLIDANTRRNLELFEPLRGERKKSGPRTLLAFLDKTETPMGARLLRTWLDRPLLDPEAIRQRQDAVRAFFESAVRRGRVRAVLSRIPDLERALSRVSAAAGTPGPTVPRDLNALRRGVETVPELRIAVLEGTGQAGERLVTSLRNCTEAAALIGAAISEDSGAGVMRPGFSDELDALRSTAKDARQYLADLERRERERTGVKSLKVGYNRVFGYYIEVSNANAAAVPDDYVRKQTLVGGERYTTPELQEHEYRVLHAEELRGELEDRLLRQVCAQVAAEGPAILATAASVAEIDVSAALAEAASLYGYVRPEVDDGDTILVRDGRHPVVERMPVEAGYVPNDVYLSSSDAQIILLTGPNMAGKSTYLRQAALIVIMAQMGSFVPAREARIGIVDRVFSRIGALDDIAAGQSTFMVEMLETAAMLHGATARSLLIFDEIGRGTSTYDGMAIARAVAEYIHTRPSAPARTLFATHYHELTEMASVLPRIRNFNVAVAEEGGTVVFLHRIMPGGADRSYGVHVAQLAGLPRPVVARAQEILETLEAAGAARGEVPVSGASRSQLSLFAPADDDGLRRELVELTPDSMTPLDALRRLYELAEKARASRA